MNRKHIPTIFYLLHFIILIVVFSVVMVNFDLIPDLVPNNYSIKNSEFVVVSYYSKQSLVILSLVASILITVTFIIVNLFVGRFDKNKFDNIEQVGLLYSVRYKQSILYFIYSIVLLAFVLFMFLYIPLFQSIVGFFAIFIIFLIGTILFSIVFMMLEMKIKPLIINEYPQDAKWIMGLYYSKSDPRFIVPKKSNMSAGSTINMANKLSWIFLFVIIVLPIAIAIFL